MEVRLDPLDLRPEFQRKTAEGIDQGCNTSAVDFDKLSPEAQEVVRITGRAVFYAFDRRTYNAIHPPKLEQQT